MPIVAGVSIGIPLLLGWFLNNIEAGKLASLAGLSILYIQSNRLIERMTFLTLSIAFKPLAFKRAQHLKQAHFQNLQFNYRKV